MTHIIFFPKGHFKKEKQRPLTALMIETLLIACRKQHKGIPFGPQDIKGSIIALINRGLVTNHTINIKGKLKETWYVTSQAINMLSAVGIKVLC